MSILEILLTKSGSTAIVVAMTLVIVYVVRRLYGPKGKFRDPHWDYQNELARLESESDKKYRMAERKGLAFPSEQTRNLMKDISLKVNAEPFIEYACKYRTGEKDKDWSVILKQDHSIRVLEKATMLIAGEGVLQDQLTMRSLLLSALYHDIGRFEQLRRYNTFSDHESCNHATLGIKVLLKEGFLDTEPAKVRRLVLAAIGLHNKQRLPRNIKEPCRMIAAALRDADKLDILQIMVEGIGDSEKTRNAAASMNITDEPDKYSVKILDAVLAGQAASYSDMRYLNDFRILLCGWVSDFNFITSMLYLKKTRLLDPIIQGLADIPEAQEAVSTLVTDRLNNLPEAVYQTLPNQHAPA